MHPASSRPSSSRPRIVCGVHVRGWGGQAIDACLLRKTPPPDLHMRTPMLLRVRARSKNRWRCVTLLCALIALLAQAQIDPNEGDALEPTTSTSAATISVLDAFRVMGSITWWGVDLAMETAGYGERGGVMRCS